MANKAQRTFLAGTRVKVLRNGKVFLGTVKVAPPTGENKDKRFVYFDKVFNGKSEKYERIDTCMAWVYVDNLQEADTSVEVDNVITIIVNETTRTTTLFDNNNRKIIARCHPDDKFSERVGASIVLSRYYDGFAEGDHVYSVEADGKVRDIVYRKDKVSPSLRRELERRLAFGNIFANRRNAEVAAKKVASVFSDNARSLP